jgi:hypothetical protein
MKTFHASKGPFAERPFYKDEQIERICSDALLETGFMPKEPGKVRIDRFVEKRFNASIIYEEDLPSKVLGFTVFGSKGVEAIHVAIPSPKDRTLPAERRINSTLAHEAGHGLMHTHLFTVEFDHNRLFSNDPDVNHKQVLCRDGESATQVRSRRGYDGRWWEFQANKAIGALLMPRDIFLLFMEQFLEKRGTFEMLFLPNARREQAISTAAEVFDVNSAVARIRIDSFFKEEDTQLTL